MLRTLLAVWTIATAMNLSNARVEVDTERPSILVYHFEEGSAGYYEFYINWEYLERANKIHNEVVDFEKEELDYHEDETEVYVSKEFKDELAYNSMTNVYFGE